MLHTTAVFSFSSGLFEFSILIWSLEKQLQLITSQNVEHHRSDWFDFKHRWKNERELTLQLLK